MQQEVITKPRVSGLLIAAHPGPCLVITGITTALADSLGAPPVKGLILVVAALAGQLSIGWSNDAYDAPRDAAAGRVSKPIVRGTATRRSVAFAAGVALVANLVLCAFLGPVASLANIGIVGAGWAYNAGLKATVWSGLAYVVGFGPIPVFAAAVAGTSTSVWLIGAAATLGLGAHFANVLVDLDEDLATGVRGLPQRVAVAHGVRTAKVVAFVLLVGASLMAVAATGRLGIGALVAVGCVLGLAGYGVATAGRRPFLAALAIAIVDVVLMVASA
jgi:4-hydroxybenzoate polyprenyltransferase